MDRYTARHRSRTRGRDKDDNDPVTLALSAQIMTVLFALLFLLVMKKVDASSYGAFKDTYVRLTGDEQSMGELLEKARSLSQGSLIEQFQSFIDSLWNAAPVRAEAPEPLPAILPEGEEEAQAGDFDLEDEEIVYPDMGYNYLGEYGGMDQNLDMTGQGGGLSSGLDLDQQMLAAPEGALLSPVILSSYLLPPLAGMVTSEYGYRLHPITDEADFHTGLDIAALEGSDIHAALAGRVEEVGESASYGNYLVLNHGNGLKTSYSHCKEILVREGMNMRQGERIALVGSTGMSTGPHLHFEVIAQDYKTDPAWVLDSYLHLIEGQADS